MDLSNIAFSCDNLPVKTVGLGALFIVYSLLEYWLGKTKKTQAASVIELLVAGATLVVTLLILKYRKRGEYERRSEGDEGTEGGH